MRTIQLTVLAATLILALQPVQAAHCTTWSTSTTNDEMIVIEIPEAPFLFQYLVNDLCQDDPHEPNDPNNPYDDEGPCLFSIWFYWESNGIPGLQRGDEVVDDTCHGMIDSDTIPI